ncbi:hypothetical protein V1514DRAFT_323981 [Lipomyces japonicus]|uniref:uncharacterized protein n=1 Tax=Lipomyces japonicus TaxID=56871 RepID=UPI0034CE5DF0
MSKAAAGSNNHNGNEMNSNQIESILQSQVRPRLSRATTMLSSTSQLDLHLLTGQYSLLLVASALLASNKLTGSVLKWARGVNDRDGVRVVGQDVVTVDLASQVRYVSVLVAASRAGHGHGQAVEHLATKLRKMSSLISDFRTFSRLWGLLGIAQWALDLAYSKKTTNVENDKDGNNNHESDEDDPVVKAITWAQVAVNVVMQPVENVAFLANHDVIDLGNNKNNKVYNISVGKLWRWSSRLWAAHLMLDFARLARQRHAGSKDDGVSKRNQEQWWREFVVDAANLPLALHWSAHDGFLPDLAIGALGTIAGGVRLVRLWHDASSRQG